MASTFKRQFSAGVTTATQVGSYVVPAATQVTAIGLTIANTSATTARVSVRLNASGPFLVGGTTLATMGAIIPPGGSLVVIGGDQKVVMEPTDSIYVNADNSCDCILSLLEIA